MNFIKKHGIWARFLGITLAIALLVTGIPLLHNATTVKASGVTLPNLVSGGDFEGGTTLPAQFEYINHDYYKSPFETFASVQGTDKPTGFTGNNLKLAWSGSKMQSQFPTINNGNSNIYIYYTIRVPVESGTTYDISFNIATTDTTGGVQLRYSYGTSKWNGEAWAGYGTTVITDGSISTITTPYSTRATATSNELWLLFGVKDNRSDISTDISVYFDDITVTPTVNLIKNGDFETGDLTRWSVNVRDSLTVDTATNLSITENNTGKVLKIAGSDSWTSIWQQNMAVKANTTYIIKFDYYIKSWFGGQYKYGPDMTDSNLTKQSINWYAADNKNMVQGAWSTFTKEITTAENQTTLAFAIASNGGAIFVDNIVLSEKLTVSATAQEGGSVSGLPASVYSGDKIDLVATPDDGYIFDGWYAEEDEISKELAYSFIAYKDIDLTAKFKAADYELIKNGDFEGGTTLPAGFETVSGYEDKFNGYYTVQSTDKPNGFTGNNLKLSWNNTDDFESFTFFTVKVPVENGTTYKLSYKIYTPDTTGSVAYRFSYGTTKWNGVYWGGYGSGQKDAFVKDMNGTVTQTITATSNELWLLFGVKDVRSKPVDGDAVVYFDDISLKKVVKVTTTAEGGTISGVPTTVAQGEKLTLTAVPNAGYNFAGWYKDGVPVAYTASYTFYAAVDTALTAKFESTNNLIADGSFEGTSFNSSWSNGSNRGSIVNTEKYDGAQSLFIEKQGNYANLYYWPLTVEKNSKYRITMMVKVPTDANIPMIKVLDNAGNGNSILDQKDGSGNTWLNVRNNNIVAGCDWQKAWFTFNSGDKTQVSLLFTGNSSAAAYIDEIEIIKYYDIKTTAESGGKISGLTEDWAYVDTPISLTATAEAGFQFDGWYENGEKLSSEATLQFNATADRDIVAKFAALDNYIVDGGFELDSLYSGWNNSFGRLSVTNAEHYEGEQSLHIAKQTDWAFGQYAMNVKPNTNYMIKMMVKIPSGAGAPLLQALTMSNVHILDGRDMSNNNFFINGGTNDNIGGDWFPVTATFNSGENTQVKISLTGNNKAEAYIDNLIVGEAVTATITAGEHGKAQNTTVMGLKNTLGALVAVPDADYMVEGWYIGGQKVSSAKTYNHLFTEDVQVELKFTVSDLPVMTKFDLSKLWCAESDNLLSDSGFQKGTGEWNTASFIKNGVLDVVEDEGDKVLYFNPDGTGRQIVYFPVTLEGNTEYMFSAEVKGKYYSDTNHMDMSFGIMTDEGEFITLKDANMGGYRDERPNVTATKSITPPSWDNNWHRRGITFKTVAPTTVWIAIAGNLSEAYLDDFMLCKVAKSTAEPVVENIAKTTSYTVAADKMGCAEGDNLVKNYNFNAGATGWEDGYGYNGLYSGVYIGDSGNDNKSLFMRSTTGYADRHYYIQWVDVKPNTDYTFSLAAAATSFEANFGLLAEGAKNYGKLAIWSVESNSEWTYNAITFNSNDSTRVGIYVMDGGRVTALDEVRLFETAKATALSSKLEGKADLPEEYIPPVEDTEDDDEDETATDNTQNDDEDDGEKTTTKKTKKKKVVKVIKNDKDEADYTLWWILGGVGAAILLAGIAVLIIILVKKKRKKGGIINA